MTFVCPVAKGMDLILSYSAYSITDSGSYHLHDKPRGEGYRFSVCLTLDSTPCLGGRERGGEGEWEGGRGRESRRHRERVREKGGSKSEGE